MIKLWQDLRDYIESLSLIPSIILVIYRIIYQMLRNCFNMPTENHLLLMRVFLLHRYKMCADIAADETFVLDNTQHKWILAYPSGALKFTCGFVGRAACFFFFLLICILFLKSYLWCATCTSTISALLVFHALLFVYQRFIGVPDVVFFCLSVLNWRSWDCSLVPNQIVNTCFVRSSHMTK